MKLTASRPIGSGGTRTNGCLKLAFAAAVFAVAAIASPALALDAKDFGWRTKEAKGVRPLLVIWIRQPDDTPASELERRKQYYEELLFGRLAHAPYPDALRTLEPTLVEYYRDQSAGKFAWRRAGFVGPLSAPVNGKGAMEVARLAVSTAASAGHLDFRVFDTNHDGTISPDELTLLVISNLPNGQANHFRGNRAFRVPGQNVTLTAGDGVVGEGGTFATAAHELFHTLGGLDLYGPWGGCYYLNGGLTLMSGTGNDLPDLEWIVNLDPWHKMIAGWIEPRLVAVGRPGTAQLAAQHFPLSAEPLRKRPLLIYSPTHGKRDFLLLEYRTPNRLGYDAQVASSGLVIWQVSYGANMNPVQLRSERQNCKSEFVKVLSVFARGAPDWRQGGNKAYTSASGEIALKWMDDTDSGVRVRVAPHKPNDPAIDISWTASGAPAALAPAPQPPVGGRT
jgi:M6 family metalloprotease-like protein